MADDIDLRVMDPFYLIRFDDGTTIRCVADLDGMREEVARIEPRDLPGFDRFLKDSAAIYEVAFKELADKPFHELKSLVLAAPDLVRLGGFRSVYSKVCQYFENEKLRVAFSFHPLLIGGNPFSTTAYYCLISHLERMHGVHFAMGGTGAIVNALCEARFARRRARSATRRKWSESMSGRGGRPACTLKSGETHRRRHRRVERRCRLHLQQASVACEAPALDEREARAGALFHEPVRLVLRHQPQVRGRVPPHDGAGPALSGAACRTSSSASISPTISASTCIARR